MTNQPAAGVGGEAGPASPTLPEQTHRCEWCRRVLPEQRLGRPRKYCSQACRQWHWVGRQRAAEIQLGEHELIVTKAELDQIHDEMYVLACAVEDAERDLAALAEENKGPASAEELGAILQWVLEAARPLRHRELDTRD